jgi:hypothetical protein
MPKCLATSLNNNNSGIIRPSCCSLPSSFSYDTTLLNLFGQMSGHYVFAKLGGLRGIQILQVLHLNYCLPPSFSFQTPMLFGLKPVDKVENVAEGTGAPRKVTQFLQRISEVEEGPPKRYLYIYIYSLHMSTHIYIFYLSIDIYIYMYIYVGIYLYITCKLVIMIY